MLEIAELNRDEYREQRQEAWHAVVRSHKAKSPEQRQQWSDTAS